MYWVVDYKCTAEASSSISYDDAEFYLNLAVVPAATKEEAIQRLEKNLSRDKITITDIRDISEYSSYDTESKDAFQLKDAYDEAVHDHDVVTALFIPSNLLEHMGIK